MGEGLKSPHLALPFLPWEPELLTQASEQKGPSYIASHAGFISLQTELLHKVQHLSQQLGHGVIPSTS